MKTYYIFFEWKIKSINNADLFSQPSMLSFTKGANNSDHDCFFWVCSVKSPLSFGHYPTQAVDLLCDGMFCVGSSADSLCNVSLYFPAVGFDREPHRRGSFLVTERLYCKYQKFIYLTDEHGLCTRLSVELLFIDPVWPLSCMSNVQRNIIRLWTVYFLYGKWVYRDPSHDCKALWVYNNTQ